MDFEIRDGFGGRLQEARTSRSGKPSQGDIGKLVARKMGRAKAISHSAVSKWEDGRLPGRDKLLALLKVMEDLGVSRLWLLTGIGSRDQEGWTAPDDIKLAAQPGALVRSELEHHLLSVFRRLSSSDQAQLVRHAEGLLGLDRLLPVKRLLPERAS